MSSGDNNYFSLVIQLVSGGVWVIPGISDSITLLNFLLLSFESCLVTVYVTFIMFFNFSEPQFYHALSVCNIQHIISGNIKWEKIFLFHSVRVAVSKTVAIRHMGISI